MQKLIYLNMLYIIYVYIILDESLRLHTVDWLHRYAIRHGHVPRYVY